eukprot:scaffold24649_cov60-Phaeocystis_antarctica.AAC.5
MGPHAAQLASQAHLGVKQSLRAVLKKRARPSRHAQVGSSLPPLRRLLEVQARDLQLIQVRERVTDDLPHGEDVGEGRARSEVAVELAKACRERLRRDGRRQLRGYRVCEHAGRLVPVGHGAHVALLR